MLVFIVASIGGAGVGLARALRDEEMWGTPFRARGSFPLLTAALPPGSGSVRRIQIADARPGEYVAVVGTEDDSGHVSVDARGAFVRVPLDRHIEGIERHLLDDALRDAIHERTWLDAHEGAILPGARVLVIGALPGDLAGFEQRP